MKQFQISRRQMLGGLLAAPVVSVTGCGADNRPVTTASADDAFVPGSAVPAAEPPTPAGQVKQALVYFVYDGDELKTTEQDLPTTANNVATIADHLGHGALCYEFHGPGSSVTVDDIQGFPSGDFALLLWMTSANQSQMELLRITASDGTGVVITVNDNGSLLSLFWNSSLLLTSPAVANGVRTLTDGSWHHVAVQRSGTSLQFFVDGTPYGATSTTQKPPILTEWGQSPATQALPAHPTVVIGDGWTGAIDTVRLYNRAFPSGSIPQAVYAWTQVKALTLDGNLEGFYPFNGNADNDLGHGGDGTIFNASLTADRFGTPATAYEFNGIDSYIAVLDDPYSSTATDFAICFWEQSTAQTVMAALSVTPGGSSLDIVFNADAGISIILDGAPVPSLSYGVPGSLTDGKWHFVLLQRAGSTLELYVDGTLQAQAQSNAIIFGDGSVVQFGKGSGASTAAGVTSFWNGALDDIQFYKDSLAPADIPPAETLQFRGRDGAGALTFQNKMWLFGGWNPQDTPVCNNQIWSSTDGINWVLVTKAPWEGRHDAGYAVFNDKLWIVGGDKNTGHYQNNVWSSSDGLNWELVTDSVPWADRATQYVLAFNNRLWLMGGQKIFETTVPPIVAYNDVYSSADGVTWNLETTNAPWSPRGLIMGSAVFQGRMWLIGGGTYDIRTFNNDVWSSADGVKWDLVLSAAPWAPRIFHNIMTFDNKLWVIAGSDIVPQDNGGLSDVWYSSDGVKWTQLQGTPWTSRHAASTFVFAQHLWIACGSDARCFDDVWKMGYAA